MEDTQLLIHDLGLDECMKMSLYSVIDGHGGDQCAHYLRKHFEQEIIKNLTDTQKGFYAS
jgi:serine/threonine protein phosphatase PrpC